MARGGYISRRSGLRIQKQNIVSGSKALSTIILSVDNLEVIVAVQAV